MACQVPEHRFCYALPCPAELVETWDDLNLGNIVISGGARGPDVVGGGVTLRVARGGGSPSGRWLVNPKTTARPGHLVGTIVLMQRF